MVDHDDVDRPVIALQLESKLLLGGVVGRLMIRIRWRHATV